MVLNSNPVGSLLYLDTFITVMAKIKTTLTFGFCLEFKRVKETVRLFSKVLKVATETIKKRYRKIT